MADSEGWVGRKRGIAMDGLHVRLVRPSWVPASFLGQPGSGQDNKRGSRKNLYGHRELNPGHLGCEPGALLSELYPQISVYMMRILVT